LAISHECNFPLFAVSFLPYYPNLPLDDYVQRVTDVTLAKKNVITSEMMYCQAGDYLCQLNAFNADKQGKLFEINFSKDVGHVFSDAIS
jgi:hypothetical protein